MSGIHTASVARPSTASTASEPTLNRFHSAVCANAEKNRRTVSARSAIRPVASLAGAVGTGAIW